MSGKFIVFEGGECTSKSTQIELAKTYLEKEGHDVIITREPGGTPLGESLRNLLKYTSEADAPCPISELLLFAAARKEHIEKVIKPALAAGKIVLSDRFAMSTYVYQGFARGLDYDIIKSVELMFYDVRADKTLIFDSDTSVLKRRLKNRKSPEGIDRFDNESEDFHNKVFNGYRELYLTNIAFDYSLIDARVGIEEIHENVIEKLKEII